MIVNPFTKTMARHRKLSGDKLKIPEKSRGIVELKMRFFTVEFN